MKDRLVSFSKSTDKQPKYHWAVLLWQSACDTSFGQYLNWSTGMLWYIHIYNIGIMVNYPPSIPPPPPPPPQPPFSRLRQGTGCNSLVRQRTRHQFLLNTGSANSPPVPAEQLATSSCWTLGSANSPPVPAEQLATSSCWTTRHQFLLNTGVSELTTSSCWTTRHQFLLNNSPTSSCRTTRRPVPVELLATRSC